MLDVTAQAPRSPCCPFFPWTRQRDPSYRLGVLPERSQPKIQGLRTTRRSNQPRSKVGLEVFIDVVKYRGHWPLLRLRLLIGNDDFSCGPIVKLANAIIGAERAGSSQLRRRATCEAWAATSIPSTTSF